MRNMTKALAVAIALFGTCVALGQGDAAAPTTNIFNSLGVLGPVFLVIALVLWWSWGGFRWILPS